MPFHAYDRSLELIDALHPIIARLETRDRKLADQLRRASTAVTLGIAEANRRDKCDRRNRFNIALGEAAEVKAALDVATKLRYVVASELAPARKLADDVCAIVYRLVHPKPKG